MVGTASYYPHVRMSEKGKTKGKGLKGKTNCGCYYHNQCINIMTIIIILLLVGSLGGKHRTST